MNCHEYEDLMISKIYGELSGKDRALLDSHVRECAECALKMKKQSRFESVFEADGVIPPPDWEKAWQKIEHSVLEKRSLLGPLPRLRWVYASAAVLAVFIFGIFIGRQWMTSPPMDITLSPAPVPFGLTSIQDYTERLELILVSFLNRSGVSRTESFKTLEQSILQDIIDQTLVLKSLAGQRGDQYQVYLLEDLELILRNIANLKSDDHRAADQLSQTIRNKELRFRLKSLENWDRSL